MELPDSIRNIVRTTPEISDFLELGLLFIITGLTGVFVGTCVLVLLLEGPGHLPEWLAITLGLGHQASMNNCGGRNAVMRGESSSFIVHGRVCQIISVQSACFRSSR